MYSGNIVDVHAHIHPKKYLKELERRTEYPILKVESSGGGFIHYSETVRSPIGDSFHDIDLRIKEMNRFNITTELLSAVNPWTDAFSSKELAIRFSKMINDEISSVVSKYKNEGRFVGLATLPLVSPTDAAGELERAVDELGLLGAIVGTNVSGTYLSDQQFLPIWKVAHDKKCLLFLHPTVPLGADELKELGLIRSLGYVFDSTVCLVKMAYAGIFDRYPQLRILSSHLAGAFPYVQGRVDTAWKQFPESKGSLSEPPSNKIRRVLYADTISYSKSALRLASEFIGIQRLMFGTDFPFEWGMDNARKSVEEAFDERELKMIYSENFEQITKS